MIILNRDGENHVDLFLHFCFLSQQTTVLNIYIIDAHKKEEWT